MKRNEEFFMSAFDPTGIFPKQRLRKRVMKVDIRLAHGSEKRVKCELRRLGYQKPNTSAIERRNATAWLMDACSVRKTLAARTPETALDPSLRTAPD